MRSSSLAGVSFGMTSGVITTVGLLMGLAASTDSKQTVIAGILVIAIADALSDSFGMFVQAESQLHSRKAMYQSALATFFAKFFVAMSFSLFFFLFSMPVAVALSVFWGLFLTAVFGLYLAKIERKPILRLVASHVILTVLVIIASHFVGQWISAAFN